jgi:hypothetical protein
MATPNRFHQKKTLGTEKVSRGGWHMVTRKLEFNLLSIDIQDMPSDKTFPFYSVAGRKICNLDITDGIVTAKIIATRANAAGCP